MDSLKCLIKVSARRAFGFSTIASLVLAIGAASVAQAIPPNQRDFDSNTVIAAKPVLVPGSLVTVNNDVARTCVIQFSADAFLSSGADVAIVGYTIDSTSSTACTSTGGPVSLTGYGGGAAIWNRIIPSGLHAIRACYGNVDLDHNGGTVTLLGRSLSVECRTQ